MVQDLIKRCRGCCSPTGVFVSDDIVLALARVTEFVMDLPGELLHVTVMDGVPDLVITEKLPVKPALFRDTDLYEKLFVAAYQMSSWREIDPQKASDLAISYADAAYDAFEKGRRS